MEHSIKEQDAQVIQDLLAALQTVVEYGRTLTPSVKETAITALQKAAKAGYRLHSEYQEDIDFLLALGATLEDHNIVGLDAEFFLDSQIGATLNRIKAKDIKEDFVNSLGMLYQLMGHIEKLAGIPVVSLPKHAKMGSFEAIGAIRSEAIYNVLKAYVASQPKNDDGVWTKIRE